MEEDIEIIRERLFEEAKQSVYPSEKLAIRDRYTDTSYLIFKTSQGVHRGSFLSFGSRRSSVVSSYGNTPTFIRKSFSSNGMLEYSVEQTGCSRLSSNKLPIITKEEKEPEETDEESGLISEIEVKQKEKIDKLEDFQSFRKICEQSKRSINMDSVAEEAIDLDDTELGSKNRKIFSHYDLPPSRKVTLHKNTSSSLPETLIDSVVDNHIDMKNSLDESKVAFLNNLIEDDITKQEKSEFDTRNEHVNLEKNQRAKNSYSEISDLPKLAIDIKISTTTDTDSVLNSIPVTASEQIISRNSSTDSINSHNTINFKRSLSINEKSSIPFTRASNTRFSLRDLPHRNPTPPKKSPRRSFKKNKTLKGYLDSITLPKESLSQSVHNSDSDYVLPPLVPSKYEFDQSDSEVSILSKLSNANNKSLQSLDDTPLFIVEEGDQVEKLLPSVSSKSGLQNLASDCKINKNFIVVQSSDTNSLGLAPLSSGNRKLSSSSLVSNQSKASSTSSCYSQTVERSSSKVKMNKHSSGNNSNGNSSTTTKTTTAYFSKKEITRVKLLKYKKSNDENNLILPPSSKGAKSSNYLFSKARIRSLSLEHNMEDGNATRDKLVETNSSRLCSVM